MATSLTLLATHIRRPKQEAFRCLEIFNFRLAVSQDMMKNGNGATRT